MSATSNASDWLSDPQNQQIIDNAYHNIILPIEGPLLTMIYFMGLVLVVSSLYILASESRRQRGNLASKFSACFIAGVLLLSFRSFLDVLSVSAFNSETGQLLSMSGGSHAITSIPARFACSVMVLLGILSTVRGIIFIKDIPDDPTHLWRGLSHFIGGILCIRIVDTALAFGDALGGEVGDKILKFITST